VAHRPLMPPAGLALAQRLAPASERRHPLAAGHSAPLDNSCRARPAPGSAALCQRRARAAYPPGRHPPHAPTPVRLDDLRIEQARQRPPARLGTGPLVLQAFGRRPKAPGAQDGRAIPRAPIAAPGGHPPWRAHARDLRHPTRGSLRGPWAHRNDQPPLAHRLNRRPPPGARRLQEPARVGGTARALADATPQGIQRRAWARGAVHGTQAIARPSLARLSRHHPLHDGVGLDLEAPGGGPEAHACSQPGQARSAPPPDACHAKSCQASQDNTPGRSGTATVARGHRGDDRWRAGGPGPPSRARRRRHAGTRAARWRWSTGVAWGPA
jgi:hypothetical protein